MDNERGNCLDCGESLLCIDDAPNGARKATCARCRAEDEHGSDAEPGVVFSRAGKREDAAQQRNLMAEPLCSILAKIPQQPQRRDSTSSQLTDLYAFANRLGLLDAADAITAIIGRR